MPAASWFETFDRNSWSTIDWLAARPALASLVLCLVALITYLPGQTNLPAIDRTEGVVALSSRYIVESGDILRPRWGANVQRTRPVGTFWAQGLAIAARPDTALNQISSYRLPSLLATALAVWLTYWLGGGLIGRTPAWMAALGVAVTPIIALHAQLAIAEALILPMTVIAQLALLAIYLDARAAAWWGWRGAFWVALGVSTWFNALAVPLLALVTVATLAMLDRRWDHLRRLQPWIGLPLLGLLALPWLASVWAVHGGTLYGDMSWRAMVDALEGGQAMKFKTIHGVFVLTLALGFVPIAPVLGPIVTRYWRRRREPVLRFLMVWLLAPIIALEVLSNKPPLYTVQAVLPAGALLAALAVMHGGAHSVRIKALPGMLVATVVLLGLIAPAVIGVLLWITDTPLSPLLAIVFITMAGLFAGAAWAAAHGHGMAWFAAGMLGTFALGVWFNGLLMPNLRNFWTAPQIAAVTAQLNACNGGGVSVTGFREPSLALAVAGKARIDSAPAAARALARDTSSYAIVASRQFDRFQQSLATEQPGAKLQRLGCIRSFNLARGCSLLFDVYARADDARARRCDLQISTDCQAKHDMVRQRLKIKHCG